MPYSRYMLTGVLEQVIANERALRAKMMLDDESGMCDFDVANAVLRFLCDNDYIRRKMLRDD